MSHAQAEPITVLGLPFEFALPVAVTGMVLIAVVVMFFFAVRGTDSVHRAEVIRAFAEIVRALGKAIRRILDAIRRILDTGVPPGGD